MKTSPYCMQCFIRQVLDAAWMVSTTPSDHERIMREMLDWIKQLPLDRPPPFLGQVIHRRLREIAGVDDPYREAKENQNRMALGLNSILKTEISASSDSLMTAVRLAIAGNIMSLSVCGSVIESDLRRSIDQGLREPSYMEETEFRKAVAEAGSILYLADNAGEIIFDRLLVEQLLNAHVTVAVKGGPVINDATINDAKAAGLHEIVEVIDNGSDAPGTILEDCSADFKKRFAESDLIIAKGQANFETLSDETRNIFFLFKIKCSVVADHIGLPVGTHILRRQSAGS
jgi:damage-control phosphatase, subfamily I